MTGPPESDGSADPETMRVYAEQAATYADRITRMEPDGDLRAFVGAVRPKGLVLDWGCGPGNSAAMMAAAGLRVEATDASPEMAALARELGVEAKVEPFEALRPRPKFDGIWANFSLLHAPRDRLGPLVALAAEALMPNGVLHLGMKAVPEDGRTEGRDPIGRFFSYWTEEELAATCRTAGLAPAPARHGEGPGLDGRVEPFLIVLARKTPPGTTEDP